MAGSISSRPQKNSAPTLSSTLAQGHPDTPSSASMSASTSSSASNAPTSRPSSVTGQSNSTINPTKSTTPTAKTPVPSLANKMAMASAITPLAQPSVQRPVSMTTKEWVIPPRPKPGRKPATDTPPTKRKAQNRAAQRAFRERRAARVGELEDLLEDQKGDHDRVECELRDRVHELEMEAQTLRTRCQVLENMLERERLERGRANGELDTIRRKWSDGVQQPAPLRAAALSSASTPKQTGHRSESSSAQASRKPLERRQTADEITIAAPRPSAQRFSISQIISPPDAIDETVALTCGSCKPNEPCACAEEVLAGASLGCGKCSLGTKCACLEESINATLNNASYAELKRPLPTGSPTSFAPDEKRQRHDSSLETDFTAQFARKKDSSTISVSATASHNPYLPLPIPSLGQSHSSRRLPPKDQCGFCKDGTYCVCADTHVGIAAPANPPITSAHESLQTQTPPPSETDAVPPPLEVTATGAIKLPSLQSLQSRTKLSTTPGSPAVVTGCGANGPGTCAQCLSDPKSGLFCRALSANFERQGRGGGGGGGCCGAGGPGGCCKGNGGKVGATGGDLGVSLSCADAYKTLASHRHFNEATDEIGSWLPLLKAAPRREPAAATPARLPIDVEAASIMSVLKGFDVRFGD